MMAVWGWVTELAVRLLGSVVNLMSPEIRELLEKGIRDLYVTACATENPWDDFGVKMLAGFCGITLEDE